MLAPIVRKDMNLFPTRQIPKHHQLKNVRARAQSLDDFGMAQRSKVAPLRQRSAVSVGQLTQQQRQQRRAAQQHHEPERQLESVAEVESGAAVAAATASTGVDAVLPGSSPSRKPSMRRPTLDIINEYEELGPSNFGHRGSNPDVRFEHILMPEPHIPTTYSDLSLDVRPHKKGIFKWLTGALKSRSSSKEKLHGDDLQPLNHHHHHQQQQQQPEKSSSSSAEYDSSEAETRCQSKEDR